MQVVGLFTKTCKGGLMQKNFYCKIFSGPPASDLKKFQGPLFAMKIIVQPHRKACKLNFHWKISSNFFQCPLQESQILRAPFCIQPQQVFVNGPLQYSCLLRLCLEMLETLNFLVKLLQIFAYSVQLRPAKEFIIVIHLYIWRYSNKVKY